MKIKLLVIITFLKIMNSFSQTIGEEQIVDKQIYQGVFTVGGDKDTYYPVIFNSAEQNRINHIKIHRRHNDAAPSEFSQTHAASLLLEIETNYGSWGGQKYDWSIDYYRQAYNTTFGGAQFTNHYRAFVVFLRGGGFQYKYETEYPANITMPSSGDLIYDSSNDSSDVYAPATLSTPNDEDIISRTRKILNNVHENGLNVGIGTSEPKSKIHISKGDSEATPHSLSILTVEDDVNAMVSILTPNDKVGYFGFADADDSYVGGMQYSHATDALTFRVNNNASNMVLNAEGNVGIGTTTPTQKLNVNGIAEIGNKATVGGVFLAQQYAGNDYIGTLSSNYSSGALILGYGAAGMADEGVSGQLVSTFDNFTANRGALRLGRGTLEFLSTPDKVNTTVGEQLTVESRFFINKEGNVGIGTTNTFDYKLAVNGTIGAKKVKVEIGSAWPDYVFAKDYELPTLASVEKHIAKKGHLENIPSAKEVKENGIELGEMNTKLLQKIEELTLYTIQQEKKIETLAKQNNQLIKENKRIDDLEEKVNAILKLKK